MERQTSENNDLPVAELESMLMRLTTNESPKTHNVKLRADPDRQNTSLHSPELNRETTYKAQNLLDNTVSSGTYDESQTKTSETTINNVFSSDFPKWVRRTLPPNPLFIETWKEEELGIEEPTKTEDALSFNSQTDSPHYGETCVSHLPESSERDNVLQTELKDELLDDAWGYSPKCLVSSGAVNKLTHQTHATITSRTARSNTDPVVQKPKEHRPLSAPSIFYVRDTEFDNKARDPGNTEKASTPGRRKDSGKEESLGVLEHEMSKIQNKGMKNKKKLWEKHNCEHNGSKKRSQDSIEDTQSVEMETEAPPPPLPPKKARYVRLARTCTLEDFKLNLEPINLMEEIFTGKWSSFLPKKSSPPQKDTGDQAMADDVVHPDIDTELHVSQGTSEQNQSEDRHDKFNDNQVDKKQDIINDTGENTCAPDIINDTGETTCAPDIINDTGETMSDLDNKAKFNKPLHTEEVEPNAKIFAIPKALLINAAKQRRVCGMYSESENSDDVYDFMIHKRDFMLMKRMSMNDPLDFSTVKSFELLDNSALKSRIHLSKKRRHRPPKKQKKEKAHRINSTFYKIPCGFYKKPPS